MRKRESMVSLIVYGKDRIKCQLIGDIMHFFKTKWMARIVQEGQ